MASSSCSTPGRRAGRTYWYRLTAVTQGGQTFTFEPMSAIAGLPILEFALPDVAPNPLRWPAVVSFAVPHSRTSG